MAEKRVKVDENNPWMFRDGRRSFQTLLRGYDP
jgi:hypothetical protein